jgi:hypothetical protein
MSVALPLAGIVIAASTSLFALSINAAEPAARVEHAAAAIADTPAKKPLDLRAPDITQLYSAEEIKRFLSKSVDSNIEEVEVEDARTHEAPPASPAVWGAIAAPFWALLHPTQAWRIIAPIPPDRAKYIGNERPYATDPNLRVLPPP